MTTHFGILKKSFATLLLCAVTYSGYSQDHKLEIGLNGGVGISSLNGTYYSDYFEDFYRTKLKGGTSYGYGLYIQANLGDVFSLALNPMYERKGGTSDQRLFYGYDYNTGFYDTLGFGTANVDFSYFTIPILAKFTFGDDTKFFVNVGPYVSFLLNAKGTLDVIPESSTVTDRDISSNYSGTDLGTSIGGGVDIPVGDFIILTGEIRGSFSIFTIDNNNNNFLLGPLARLFDGGQRHSVGNILVGAKFIIPTD